MTVIVTIVTETGDINDNLSISGNSMATAH